MLMLM
jgi:hypothetical protein